MLTFREAFQKIDRMTKYAVIVDAKVSRYTYSDMSQSEARVTYHATLFRTQETCECVNAPTLERLVAACEAKVESWRTGEYSAIEAADVAKIESFDAPVTDNADGLDDKLVACLPAMIADTQ